MQLVCHEQRRKWTWYYNSEVSEYVRLDDVTGRMKGTIRGVNLPNPDMIEAARKTAKAKGQLPISARDCADVVTIKLWEHWNAKSNN
jgi:hypothetical protein